MNERWQPSTFSLRFSISELTLFAARFSVMLHWSSLKDILANSVPELPTLDDPAVEGLILHSCPGPSTDAQIARDGQYIAYTLQAYQHCYVDLHTSWAAYQAKFSSKSRGTLQRKVRKLVGAANAAVTFRRYCTPEDMPEFYRLARQISRLTYQERLLDAGLPAEPEFLACLVAAAEQGQVRGYLLFHSGSPAAYLYCPIDDGVLVYSHLGFEPKYAEWSPGNVLLWLALEDLFAEDRFDYLDFTEGDNAQKLFFSTGQLPCYNKLLVRRGWRNWMLLRGHRGFGQLVALARDLADRNGWGSKFRRFVRRPV